MQEFAPEARLDAAAPLVSRPLVSLLESVRRVLLARPEWQWVLRFWLVHLSGAVLEPRAAFPWLVQC